MNTPTFEPADSNLVEADFEAGRGEATLGFLGTRVIESSLPLTKFCFIV